jgi:protein-tyrosine phosphatase
MMGRLNRDQRQLFHWSCLDEAVPDDHRTREIAAVLELPWVYAELVHCTGQALDRSGGRE